MPARSPSTARPPTLRRHRHHLRETFADLPARYPLRRVIPMILLAGFVLLTAWVLVIVVATAPGSPYALGDFHTYYHAGSQVLGGRSPYPPLDPRVIADQRQFVYPAPAALGAAALALLPFSVAAYLFEIGAVAAVLASFWLCGERRVFAYAAACLSPVILEGVKLGTVMPYLMLGTALVWRFRGRAWIAGLCAAGLVALKLFPWPVVVWLWVSGRRRAAVVATVATALVMLGSWAVIGFAGFRDYPQMLSMLAREEGWMSYATGQLYAGAGAGREAGQLLAYATAALLCVAGWRVRREEAVSFALFVCAGLVATPLMWENYLGLALVCVAVLRPRRVWVWAVPLALWAVPISVGGAHPGRVAYLHAVWAATLLLAYASRARGPAVAGSADPASPQRRNATGRPRSRAPRRWLEGVRLV